MNRVIRKRLGDIVNFKRGYDLPSYNRREGNYPIISSGGISGYHSEFKKDGEGLITGRYGTLGEMYYINGKYWPHNTALYATDFKGNYPKYVYFLMKCLGNLKTSDKSTVPGVNRNDLHEIVVTYIKPEFQKEIADILFLIDAKIELNNRINRELEAMAKTLYDYWFVQFDFPNEQGKPYKSSGGKMVYNKKLKREIPETWEVLKLGDIGKVSMCKRIHKHETSLYEEIPFYKISTFGKIADVFISRKIFNEYKTKYSYPNKGDILISAAGTIGKTVIFDGDDSFFQDSNIVWVDNDETIAPNAFLYILYQTKPWVTTIGSTIKRLYNNDLRNIFFAYPSLKLVIQNGNNVSKRFSNIVVPSLNKIIQIKKENQQLSELRDWLLPMLMNGQVTVKEAEEKLSMAAEPGAGRRKEQRLSMFAGRRNTFSE